jgi:hypothetical protein
MSTPVMAELPMLLTALGVENGLGDGHSTEPRSVC